MKNLLPTLALLVALPFALSAQYCTPSANCNFNSFIDGVEFNTISNLNTGGTNCNSGAYTYYSSSSSVISPGFSYTLTLTPSSAFGQFLAAWIDFNQDGDFLDAGEYIFGTNSQVTTPVSSTIVIPGTTQPGTLRMRVRSNGGSFILPNESCLPFFFGETEDYNLTVQALNQPPIANFSGAPTVTCSGAIQFNDLSINFPNTWLWDFGDNTTSTLANPSHTYTSSGTYTVSLLVSNSFGSDSITFTNYINVNLGAALTPISCLPFTGVPVAGFGITNVTFAGINNNSPDAQTAGGYEDHTCTIGNLTVGQTFPISITTNQPTSHNIRAWIDWNNDGVLNNTTELVFSANNALVGTGSVSIPSTAVLNTGLRLRISADYDLQPIPTPCSNLVNGQAEDYAVIVQANTSAPAAAFATSPTTTCDGQVAFTDQSVNVPTAWFWTFGDGATSFQQNPTHTYATNGSYTVELIASNLNGSDTLEKINEVTVNLAGQLTAASCTPQTGSYCCNYGIYYVGFESISRNSGSAAAGYQDFSCSDNTVVVAGNVYSLIVNTGLGQNEDVRAWIDYDNNGSFSSTEMVLSSNNNMQHNNSVTIPSGAVQNQALRMRIWSDFSGSSPGPCANPQNGQVEDYAVTVVANLPPPIANFTADTTITCTGTINFTDQSQNSPNTFAWDFGDNNTDAVPNPIHTYTTPGIYSVVLTVTNASGSHTLSKPNYIIYDPNACTGVNLPVNGVAPTQTGCAGSLYDNGGAGNDYANNSASQITIQPAGATSVTLSFTAFAYATGDYLRIYDGPSTSSPLIGQYDGFALPNGGTITSSGGAITVEQFTDGSTTNSGFALNWLCSLNQLPVASFTVDNTYTCDRIVQFTDLSTGGATSWSWAFGDGQTSTLQNPQHTYGGPGDFTVSLTVTNPNGSDDSIVVDYIKVDTILCLPRQGAGVTQDDCSGRVYDSGGLQNYPGGTSSTMTIAPTSASSVTLDVSGFAMGNGVDFLEIYDGPNQSSPLIGSYDISSSSSFSVTANSGAVTIFQNSDGAFHAAGFVIDWSCSTIPEPPSAFFISDSTETCSGAIQFSDQSTKVPTSWDWDFGDGNSSTQQNPQHTYLTDGMYTVTLIATNSLGSDTLEAEDYIHRDKQFCPVSVGEPIQLESSMQVYPNPSEGELTVTYTSSQSEALQLLVFNLLGEILVSENHRSTGNFSSTLNLEEAPPGIYFVSLVSENDRKTVKVILH